MERRRFPMGCAVAAVANVRAELHRQLSAVPDDSDEPVQDAGGIFHHLPAKRRA